MIQLANVMSDPSGWIGQRSVRANPVWSRRTTQAPVLSGGGHHACADSARCRQA